MALLGVELRTEDIASAYSGRRLALRAGDQCQVRTRGDLEEVRVYEVEAGVDVDGEEHRGAGLDVLPAHYRQSGGRRNDSGKMPDLPGNPSKAVLLSLFARVGKHLHADTDTEQWRPFNANPMVKG